MYTCPMHPEVKQHGPGRCPKCGMDLVKEGEMSTMSHHDSHHSHKQKDNYKPLFIIISLIVLATSVAGLNDIRLNQFSWEVVMSNFMAGFFLVFSAFKLLDIKGFAEAYFTYDLLAKKWFSYGYVYPFLELLLGLLFLIQFTPPIVNIFTLILMTFSGIGVALKLAKHEKFECACLGTFLKVPLTKVTLIEDFGMAVMALLMLLF